MDTKPQIESPAATPPLVNIVGEKVALGPLRKDLIPTYTRWYNDFNTLRTLGAMPVPLTVELEEKWYERVIAARRERSSLYRVRAGTPCVPSAIAVSAILTIATAPLNLASRLANRTPAAKGYGTETAQLMLGYAFTALSLHNVKLTVHEYNLAGIRAYTKAGFKQYGRRREKILMGGRHWDEIHMECLATEWGPSPALAEIFKPDEPRPSP